MSEQDPVEDSIAMDLAKTLPDPTPELSPPESDVEVEAEMGTSEVKRGYYQALIPGLIFALIGVLIGLRALAIATLPHILTLDAGINYQEVTDGLPVPRLLDWNLTYIEGLISLRDLGGILLLLWNLLVYGLLALVAIRTLNSSFRPFRVTQTTKSEDTSQNLAASNKFEGNIEFTGIKKTLSILLITGIPFAILWLATSSIHTKQVELYSAMNLRMPLQLLGPIWAIRLVGLGLVLFLGFHKEGLAGNFNSPHMNASRKRFPLLIFSGVAWGLASYCILRWTMPQSMEPLLTIEQSLGTFNIATWKEVAEHFLLSAALSWFVVGYLIAFLVQRRRTGQAILVSTSLCIVALGLSLWGHQVFTTSYLIRRYNLSQDVLASIPTRYRQDRGGSGVPAGSRAAHELALRTGVKIGPGREQPARNILIFRDDGSVFNVLQNGYTIDGLTASPSSADVITRFLRNRRYRSSLSWVALEHLFDLCALHFDTTSALDSLLDDQSFGPHLEQTNLITETLFFICSANRENLALLNKWADPSRFAHPDRASKRLIGDLYRRFGAVENALTWYRNADMPRSFLTRIRSERPLFHTGRVSGVLRLNGRPLVGVQIGVVPWLMNGLPRNLEPYVIQAQSEIVSSRGVSPLFPAFQPTPFAFRWISASTVTNTNGSFTVEGLTEGKYRFICTFPSEISLATPFDAGLRAVNPPTAFAVHYGNPDIDLGIIDLNYSSVSR